MFRLLFLIISVESLGYDNGDGGGSANACGRPYRAGRLYKPPCDLRSGGGYCMDAGENYPWHAVKRFVKENRGLMRRMYGERPEGSLLREELARSSQDTNRDRLPRSRPQMDLENELFDDDDDDELEYNDEYSKGYAKFEGRFMHDENVLRTKFVYSEEPTSSIKLAGLKMESLTKEINSNEESTEENMKTTTTLDENVTGEEEDMTSTTESTTTPIVITPLSTTRTTTPAVSGVLFQDMDEKTDKMKMNYKLVGVNACPVKEEVVAPFWANNTRGETLALLNMYPFEQYVHWEKCSFEHKQMYCRDGCKCEQQYRLHRLLAYDPNNECKGIFSDWFRFPSCCICKCYGLPSDFRVTSRSPRKGEGGRN